MCLLGSRFLIHGSGDPFDNGWPLYLQAGALATAVVVTLLARRPAAAALGVYGGLAACMLASGRAAYPV